MSASQNRLYFRLQRTAHSLQKRADRLLIEACGITATQAAALAVLAREGATTQRRIAKVLGVNESAMTGLIGRLEQLELITRRRDPEDVRAWRVELAAPGLQAAAKAQIAFASINAALDAAVDSSQIAQLCLALDSIDAAIGQARMLDRVSSKLG